MAQFKSGSGAVRHTHHDDKVSTVFACSTKGTEISIYQKTDGSTSWYIDQNPQEEECLTLFTNVLSMYLRLDTFAILFNFRNVLDFIENYEFYTIDRVEIAMFVGSTFTSSTFAADYSVLATNPIICYSVDRRNSNPENLESLLVNEDVGLKQMSDGLPIEMSYAPTAYYNLAVNGQKGAPVFSPKLSTATPNLDHFGAKFAVFGLNAKPQTPLAIGLVSFVVKQYVTFYNKRVSVV